MIEDAVSTLGRTTPLLKRCFEMLFENLQWCSGEFHNMCPMCHRLVPGHTPNCDLATLQNDIKDVLSTMKIKVDDSIHSVVIIKKE